MKRTMTILSAVVAATAALAGIAAAAGSPGIKTGGADSVKQTSAVLHAIVNPEGSKTHFQFQYGLTSAYGSSTALKVAGSGTKAVDVQQGVGSLIPGTVYHFRVVATNAGGLSVGNDKTFTTTGHPPAVATTAPAANIGKTSATLEGAINPNGASTTWEFQYGPTTTYCCEAGGGTLTPTTTPQTITFTLTQLSPGSWFHYRIIAAHGATTSYGADEAFFTKPANPPTPKVKRFASPRVDRHKPYVFTIHGALTVPKPIPAAFGCTGNVRVRYYLGKKRVLQQVAPLSATCGYSSTASFKHFQGTSKERRVKFQNLRVFVHFGGNGYLAASTSAAGKALTLG